MGIAALTLGIVSLVSWIIPFIGLPVSAAGLIVGFIALGTSRHQKGRTVTGLVMCFIGLIFSIGVIVGLVTAGFLLEEFLPEYFGY